MAETETIGSIMCPVCCKCIDTHTKSANIAAQILDSHVSRCLRQSQARSSHIVSYKEEVEESVDSDSDELDSVSDHSKGEDFEEFLDDFNGSSDNISDSEEDVFFGDFIENNNDESKHKNDRSESSPKYKSAKASKISNLKKKRELTDDILDVSFQKRLSKLNDEDEESIQSHISAFTMDCSTSDRNMTHTEYGSFVYGRAWNKLYAHQKSGCEFLWNLYKEGSGGLLADEMGLGNL